MFQESNLGSVGMSVLGRVGIMGESAGSSLGLVLEVAPGGILMHSWLLAFTLKGLPTGAVVLGASQ